MAVAESGSFSRAIDTLSGGIFSKESEPSDEISVTGASAGGGLWGVRVEGKTLLNLWENPTGTGGGITVSEMPDGTLSVSGTATSNVNVGLSQPNIKEVLTLLPGHEYTVSCSSFVDSDGFSCFAVYFLNGSTNVAHHDFAASGEQEASHVLSKTFTAPASFDSVRLCLYVSSGATVSGTYAITMYEGSGEQDWSPSGVSSVGIKTFQNLWHVPFYEDDLGSYIRYSEYSGLMTIRVGTGEYEKTAETEKFYGLFFPGRQYTISTSGTISGSNFYIGIRFYDFDGAVISSAVISSSPQEQSFFVPIGTVYSSFFLEVRAHASANASSFGIMVNHGAGAMAFRKPGIECGSVEVFAHGSNLYFVSDDIHYRMVSGATHGGDIHYGNSDGSFTTYQWLALDRSEAIPVRIKKGTKLFFKVEGLNDTGTFVTFYNKYGSFNGEKNGQRFDGGYAGSEIELEDDVSYFTVSMESYDDPRFVSGSNFYPMLAPSDSFSWFEKGWYGRAYVQLPAGHPYLAALEEGVKDELTVYADGTATLVARVGRQVYPGDVEWSDQNSGSFWSTPRLGIPANTGSYGNESAPIVTDIGRAFTGTNYLNYITNVPLDDFREYMAGRTLTAFYPLQETETYTYDGSSWSVSGGSFGAIDFPYSETTGFTVYANGGDVTPNVKAMYAGDTDAARMLGVLLRRCELKGKAETV